MFNLSGSEIVVILLLALVVLGPEKLPDFLRRAGRTYAELKKMGNSFQAEMKSVLDEPMQEIRETADLLKKSVDFTDGEMTNRRTPPRLPTAVKQRPSSTSTAPAVARATTVTDDEAPPTTAVPAEPVDPVTVDQPSPDDTPTQVRSPEDELINRTLSGDA